MRVGRDGVMTAKNGRGAVSTGQAATLIDLAQAYTFTPDRLRTIHQLIVPVDDGSTAIYNARPRSTLL